MKKWLIGIVFTANLVFGQGNLVPNPSFEDQTNCAPAITDNFGGGVLLAWYNPNIATPDYYNSCWDPSLQFYYAPPDGQGFIGLCTYTTGSGGSNIREYASVLVDTMLVASWYEVSFRARIMRDRSRFASNNLGIHFSDTLLHSDNGLVFNYYTPPLLEAQVKYFNNEVISDSSGWTLVRGLYQAHGGEKYLTLGNFNTDDQTTQGMEYMDGTTWQTYFLIDMVSVIPLDSMPGGIPAYAGPDQTIYINDTAFIGQKISNMPSVWQKLDGTSIATNTAGVYVSPQINTTYVVTQTLNGVYTTDTVTVFVIDNLGIEEGVLSNFTVSPNPNKGIFMLQLQQSVKEITELVIYDNTGRKVASQKVQLQTNEITIDLSPGVYFVQLQGSETKGAVQRIVVE